MKSPCEETSFIIHRALWAERLNCFDIRTAPVPGLKQLLPPTCQVEPKFPIFSGRPFGAIPASPRFILKEIVRFHRNTKEKRRIQGPYGARNADGFYLFH